MRKWNLLWLVVVLMGCDSSRVFEEFQDIDSFWNTDKNMSFNFEIEESQEEYQIIAQFKNDVSYPYRNLYFQYSLKMSTDSLLTQELKQIQLFEAKTGEPLGSGLGDQFDNEVMIDQITFPQKGTYQVDLQQFMRIDSLTGIHRVGIRIQKVQ